MKTSHEENIEVIEAEILRLREEIQVCELQIKYPPPGCSLPETWRIQQTDVLEKLKKSLALRLAALRDWSEQLNLSFDDGFRAS